MSERPVSLPGEPVIDLAQGRAHGLTEAEFRRIEEILGRTPNYTELGVFSVSWSEHCSYKSSRKYLKTLPSKSELVVQGPGENAGAIDVGDGWAAVFKIESHNHPSYVEPHQGAATGVGGILRDIFTMGARPVASMDSLKFGAFDHPRTRYLLGGVVGGIGGYGNCVGVPTVAGEVMFDAAYNGNILVNAFCLGLVRKGEMLSAKARGVGNSVMYVGSATGRDGIHGASLLASAEFDKESETKRPTVQVGDPFTEKLLIEACLEAGRTGAIVAIQDMGAAGLTSSSSEMAARGGLGIELDLDQVPLREHGITPYEILLSESQERMLLVAAPGREDELAKIFEKWDLHAVVIGRIIAEKQWRARWHGQIVADIPVGAIADEAPIYDRPHAPPKAPTARVGAAKSHPKPADALKALLDNPNVASKRWVFRQYDSIVLSNTVEGPGSDAAVLRIKNSRRGIALKVDSNPRACEREPYIGAIATVCEAVRNVACVGAHAVGITNCLNYGNPERPEIMWQFVRGIDALRDASLAFGAPIVSGNVSFYNETEGRAIPPTPTIAVLGVMSDVDKRVTQHFKRPGDAIVLIRTAKPSMAATEYEAMFKLDGGPLMPIDLDREKALIEAVVGSIEQGLIQSAHDVSDGGLMVALAEACFNPAKLVGAEVDLGSRAADPAELFGEGPSTIVVSIADGDLARAEKLFSGRGLEFSVIGRVAEAAKLRVAGVVEHDTSELLRIYEDALPRRLRASD
jgi:phosphoribosylformylglycinamidine synthase subunit PurL